MTKIYSIHQDTEELKKMAEYLEDYVQSDQLYGQPWGAFQSELVMTIGALIMRLYRLNILQSNNFMDMDQTRVLRLAMEMDQKVSNEWQHQYRIKLVDEAYSRLDAMTAFFEEHRADPEAAVANYPPEMQRRTIVQAIFQRMRELNIVDDALLKKAQNIDVQLRAVVQPAVFQWDNVLRNVYSPEVYWWLYCEPVTEMTTA